MRHIRKRPVPKELSSNCKIWTHRLQSLVDANKGKSRKDKTPIPDSVKYAYRQEPAIKAALVRECSDKCVYCEAKVTHIAPGDTEHIWPISRDAKKAFVWSNLVLACPNCNSNKRVHTGLVNPIDDHPEAHLQSYGPMLSHKIGSVKGEDTISKLDLNRVKLLEHRQEKLALIAHQMERVVTANKAHAKLLLSAIKKEFEPSKEYSLVVENFVRARLQEYPDLLGML